MYVFALQSERERKEGGGGGGEIDEMRETAAAYARHAEQCRSFALLEHSACMVL